MSDAINFEVASVSIGTTLDFSNIEKDLTRFQNRIKNDKNFKVKVGVELDIPNNLTLTPKVDDSALTKLNEHFSLKAKHATEIQKSWNKRPLTPKVDVTQLDELGASLDTIQEKIAAISNASVNVNVRGEQESRKSYRMRNATPGRGALAGRTAAVGAATVAGHAVAGPLGGIAAASAVEMGNVQIENLIHKNEPTVNRDELMLKAMRDQIAAIARVESAVYDNTVRYREEFERQRVYLTNAQRRQKRDIGGPGAAARNRGLSTIDREVAHIIAKDFSNNLKLAISRLLVQQRPKAALGTVLEIPPKIAIDVTGAITRAILNTVSSFLSQAAGNLLSSVIESQADRLKTSLNNFIKARTGKSYQEVEHEFLQNAKKNAKKIPGPLGGAIAGAIPKSTLERETELTPKQAHQAALKRKREQLENELALEELYAQKRETIRAYDETRIAKDSSYEDIESSRAVVSAYRDQIDALNEQLKGAGGDQRKELIESLKETEKALKLEQETLQKHIGTRNKFTAALYRQRKKVEAINRSITELQPNLDAPLGYLQAVELAYGNTIDPANIPKLTIGDAAISEDAIAEYGISSNSIKISDDLADKLRGGLEQLTNDELETLLEELFHAGQSDFGSARGQNLAKMNRMANEALSDISPDELDSIREDLEGYTEEERKFEIDAKIRARRARQLYEELNAGPELSPNLRKAAQDYELVEIAQQEMTQKASESFTTIFDAPTAAVTPDAKSVEKTVEKNIESGRRDIKVAFDRAEQISTQMSKFYKDMRDNMSLDKMSQSKLQMFETFIENARSEIADLLDEFGDDAKMGTKLGNKLNGLKGQLTRKQNLLMKKLKKLEQLERDIAANNEGDDIENTRKRLIRQRENLLDSIVEDFQDIGDSYDGMFDNIEDTRKKLGRRKKGDFSEEEVRTRLKNSQSQDARIVGESGSEASAEFIKQGTQALNEKSLPNKKELRKTIRKVFGAAIRDALKNPKEAIKEGMARDRLAKQALSSSGKADDFVKEKAQEVYSRNKKIIDNIAVSAASLAASAVGGAVAGPVGAIGARSAATRGARKVLNTGVETEKELAKQRGKDDFKNIKKEVVKTVVGMITGDGTIVDAAIAAKEMGVKNPLAPVKATLTTIKSDSVVLDSMSTQVSRLSRGERGLSIPEAEIGSITKDADRFSTHALEAGPLGALKNTSENLLNTVMALPVAAKKMYDDGLDRHRKATGFVMNASDHMTDNMIKVLRYQQVMLESLQGGFQASQKAAMAVAAAHNKVVEVSTPILEGLLPEVATKALAAGRARHDAVAGPVVGTGTKAIGGVLGLVEGGLERHAQATTAMANSMELSSKFYREEVVENLNEVASGIGETIESTVKIIKKGAQDSIEQVQSVGNQMRRVNPVEIIEETTDDIGEALTKTTDVVVGEVVEEAGSFFSNVTNTLQTTAENIVDDVVSGVQDTVSNVREVLPIGSGGGEPPKSIKKAAAFSDDDGVPSFDELWGLTPVVEKAVKSIDHNTVETTKASMKMPKLIEILEVNAKATLANVLELRKQTRKTTATEQKSRLGLDEFNELYARSSMSKRPMDQLSSQQSLKLMGSIEDTMALALRNSVEESPGDIELSSQAYMALIAKAEAAISQFGPSQGVAVADENAQMTSIEQKFNTVVQTTKGIAKDVNEINRKIGGGFTHVGNAVQDVGHEVVDTIKKATKVLLVAGQRALQLTGRGVQALGGAAENPRQFAGKVQKKLGGAVDDVIDAVVVSVDETMEKAAESGAAPKMLMPAKTMKRASDAATLALTDEPAQKTMAKNVEALRKQPKRMKQVLDELLAVIAGFSGSVAGGAIGTAVAGPAGGIVGAIGGDLIGLGAERTRQTVGRVNSYAREQGRSTGIGQFAGNVKNYFKDNANTDNFVDMVLGDGIGSAIGHTMSVIAKTSMESFSNGFIPGMSAILRLPFNDVLTSQVLTDPLKNAVKDFGKKYGIIPDPDQDLTRLEKIKKKLTEVRVAAAKGTPLLLENLPGIIQHAFATTMKALPQMLKGLITLAPQLAVLGAVLVPVGQAALQAGENIESLMTTLTVVEGGTDAAAEAFTKVSQNAQDMNLSIGRSIETYTMLAASAQGTTLEGFETERLTSSIGQIQKAYGLTGQQAERVGLAFSQMIAKGKVSAEELRQQLGEVLPGAMQKMASALGVSVQQLDRMMASGQLMTNEVLPQFIDQLQSDLAAGMVATQNSLNNYIVQFQNVRDSILEEIGAPLVEIKKVVLKVMAEIMTAIQPMVAPLMKALVLLATVAFGQVAKGLIMFASNMLLGVGAAVALKSAMWLLIKASWVLAKNLIIFEAFMEVFGIFDSIVNKTKTGSTELRKFAKASKDAFKQYETSVEKARNANQEFTKELSQELRPPDVNYTSYLEDSIIFGKLLKTFVGDNAAAIDGINEKSRTLEAALQRIANIATYLPRKIVGVIDSLTGLYDVIPGGEMFRSVTQDGFVSMSEADKNQLAIDIGETFQNADKALSDGYSQLGIGGEGVAELGALQDYDDQLQQIEKELATIGIHETERREQLMDRRSLLQDERAATATVVNNLRNSLNLQMEALEATKKVLEERRDTVGLSEEEALYLEQANERLETTEKMLDDINGKLQKQLSQLGRIKRTFEEIENKYKDERKNLELNQAIREADMTTYIGNLKGAQREFAKLGLEQTRSAEQMQLIKSETEAMMKTLMDSSIREALDLSGFEGVDVFNIDPSEIRKVVSRFENRESNEAQILEVAATQLERLQDLKLETAQQQLQIQQTNVELQNEVNELTKEFVDFTRDLTEESRNLKQTIEETKMDTIGKESENRLKKALSGLEDTFADKFVNGIVEIVNKLNEIFLNELQAQNQIQEQMNQMQQKLREAHTLRQQAMGGQFLPAGMNGSAPTASGSTGGFAAAWKSGNKANIENEMIGYLASQGFSSQQIAYILATAKHESDNFNTMEEYASGAAYEGRADLGNTQSGDGVRYKGRGLVQLTGRRNYEKYSEILGVDLINNPELAEDPEMALRILAHGMRDGTWTGRSIDDYTNAAGSVDFTEARRVVNGTDRAAHIANLAQGYLDQVNNFVRNGTQQTFDNAANQLAQAPVATTNNLQTFKTGLLAAQEYGASRGNGSRLHAGQDFDLNPDDTFESYIGGRVTRVGHDPGGYGHYIDVFNEATGVVERIAELDELFVGMGDVIQAGQTVGQGTLDTGVVHYEIRMDANAQGQGGFGHSGTVDPIAWLESHGIVERRGNDVVPTGMMPSSVQAPSTAVSSGLRPSIATGGLDAAVQSYQSLGDQNIAAIQAQAEAMNQGIQLEIDSLFSSLNRETEEERRRLAAEQLAERRAQEDRQLDLNEDGLSDEALEMRRTGLALERQREDDLLKTDQSIDEAQRTVEALTKLLETYDPESNQSIQLGLEKGYITQEQLDGLRSNIQESLAMYEEHYASLMDAKQTYEELSAKEFNQFITESAEQIEKGLEELNQTYNELAQEFGFATSGEQIEMQLDAVRARFQETRTGLENQRQQVEELLRLDGLDADTKARYEGILDSIIAKQEQFNGLEEKALEMTRREAELAERQFREGFNDDLSSMADSVATAEIEAMRASGLNEQANQVERQLAVTRALREEKAQLMELEAKILEMQKSGRFTEAEIQTYQQSYEQLIGMQTDQNIAAIDRDMPTVANRLRMQAKDAFAGGIRDGLNGLASGELNIGEWFGNMLTNIGDIFVQNSIDRIAESLSQGAFGEGGFLSGIFGSNVDNSVFGDDNAQTAAQMEAQLRVDSAQTAFTQIVQGGEMAAQAIIQGSQVAAQTLGSVNGNGLSFGGQTLAGDLTGGIAADSGIFSPGGLQSTAPGGWVDTFETGADILSGGIEAGSESGSGIFGQGLQGIFGQIGNMLGGSGGGLDFGSILGMIGGLFYKGGPVPNFANGGIAGAMSKERRMSGNNPQLAVVNDGEFIMSAPAVQNLGIPALNAMNKYRGGPIKSFAKGGSVLSAGNVTSTGVQIPTVMTTRQPKLNDSSYAQRQQNTKHEFSYISDSQGNNFVGVDQLNQLETRLNSNINARTKESSEAMVSNMQNNPRFRQSLGMR